MARTSKQKKRLADAQFWGGLFKGSRFIADAERIDRQIEKRKRRQFRHTAEAR